MQLGESRQSCRGTMYQSRSVEGEPLAAQSLQPADPHEATPLMKLGFDFGRPGSRWAARSRPQDSRSSAASIPGGHRAEPTSTSTEDNGSAAPVVCGLGWHVIR